MKNTSVTFILTAAAIGLVVSLAALAGVNSALSMPDVHFSYTTEECVKVINYTDEVFGCENLPSKFNHVWVQ
jgi:hypothetical protein